MKRYKMIMLIGIFLIAIILYGGLYLVLAYRNAKKLERQIKNKDLPKELKDLDEE